jgi:hypothetical protein
VQSSAIMELHPDSEQRSTSPRRFLRFSLRGLLVLVAVCSVWLGIVFHRAREQARAVAAIRAAHGYVVYDYQGGESGPFATSEVPSWLLDNLGVDFFHNVTDVLFDRVPVNDDVLAAVSRLPEVRYLFFSSLDVTGQSLANIKWLAKLEALGITAWKDESGEFDPPDLTDAGLAVLAELKQLEDLHIHGAKITDHGLEHLKGMTKLERLTLNDTQVTRAGAEELHKALPKCNIFVTRGDSDVFSAGPDVPLND